MHHVDRDVLRNDRNATAADIRRTYRGLVRRYHPDSNGGDRSHEGKLQAVVNAIRLQESTYKSAGSVHACALFRGDQLQLFVEDVGRHNAVDTIAGWLALQDPAAGAPTGAALNPPALDKIFYTTGRLTSEMVIKTAQMGIPFLVSRSGLTHMGWQIAHKIGLTMVGRAQGKHYLLFSGEDRFTRD